MVIRLGVVGDLILSHTPKCDEVNFRVARRLRDKSCNLLKPIQYRLITIRCHKWNEMWLELQGMKAMLVADLSLYRVGRSN